MIVRQLKLAPILLVILFLFLQYRLWFEPGGILDMVRLKKHLAKEVQENEQLKKRNDVLMHQVIYLQKNQDAIESRARQELGMIKKGETFYQTVE
jgi:cell division protein FtsB